MVPDTAQKLGALLQQQIQNAEQLKQILQNETDALITRDLGAIQHLSQEKSEQSSTLEKLSQPQQQLLQAAGLPYTAEGMKRFIESQPSNWAIPLRKQQLHLQTLLESCQKQNLINGNIITANRYSAETALTILRGQFMPDNLVYSADGKAATSSSSTSLIKA